MLKVKLKSLAAEAKIIRLEESRRKGWVRESLHNHRVLRVQKAARSTLLAYAFIRGRKYRDVERTAKTDPNWLEVARMVKDYGDIRYEKKDDEMKRFDEWRKQMV